MRWSGRVPGQCAVETCSHQASGAVTCCALLHLADFQFLNLYEETALG